MGVALTVDYNYVGSGEEGSLFEAIAFDQASGIDGGDPGFADVAANDFHLLPTSRLVGGRAGPLPAVPRRRRQRPPRRRRLGHRGLPALRGDRLQSGARRGCARRGRGHLL